MRGLWIRESPSQEEELELHLTSLEAQRFREVLRAPELIAEGYVGRLLQDMNLPAREQRRIRGVVTGFLEALRVASRDVRRTTSSRGVWSSVEEVQNEPRRAVQQAEIPATPRPIDEWRTLADQTARVVGGTDQSADAINWERGEFRYEPGPDFDNSNPDDPDDGDGGEDNSRDPSDI